MSFVEQEAVKEKPNEEPMVEVAEEKYYLAADEGEIIIVSLEGL